uniref:IMS import disulfide relay-system CHCH-CHCH-like Cx9C domain-containing protein n=1 Tax=Strigamia maritima TaxID=126957 RepID=T1JK98_STRMM
MIPDAAKKSVANAQKKFRSFSKIFAQCESEATAYGVCVASKEQITQNQCGKEFEALKRCFLAAVIKEAFKVSNKDTRLIEIV